MNNNSKTIFFYESSLFKTTEYRISSDEKLHINELSYTGRLNKKVFSLDKIKTKKQLTAYKIPSILFVLSLLVCVPSISNWNANNYDLLTVSSCLALFLSFILSIYLITKSINKYEYTDSFTGMFLFSLRKQYSLTDSKISFIDQLNYRIDKSEKKQTIDGNFIDFGEKQRTLNNKHLDALYNSGMVDENTYNNISSNINNHASDNLLNVDFRPMADVIYLSSNR